VEKLLKPKSTSLEARLNIMEKLVEVFKEKLCPDIEVIRQPENVEIIFD